MLARSDQYDINVTESRPMTLDIVAIQPFIALIAGILILIVPRILNYVVGIYLIIIGIMGSGRISSFILPTERRLARAARLGRREPLAHHLSVQASDRWQPGEGIPRRYAVTGPVSAMPGNSSGDTRRAAMISRLSSRNSGN